MDGEGFPETADIETASQDYARRFDGPVGAWFLERQAAIVLSLLPPPPLKVLDIGGGHGQIAGPLCAAGYSVTVLGSAASCATPIAHLIASGRCAFDVGNLLHLPFADRAWEAAVCFRLLPHCTAWQALMADMTRVTRDVVIADYPTSQGWNALAPLLFKAKHSYEKNTRRWRNFKHEEVANAFRDGGFVVDNRQGQYILPMVLHRVLRCPRLSRCLEGIFRFSGLTKSWGSPVIIRAQRRHGVGHVRHLRDNVA